MDNSYQKIKSKDVITRRGMLMLCLGFLLITQNVFAAQITASAMEPSFHKDQRLISVHFVKEPLANVLHELARKVKVGLSYKTEAMPDKMVTFQAKKASIYTVLDSVLAGTGLYAALSQSRKVILINKKEPKQRTIYQSTITGTVTDAGNGEALPGVNILVIGTTTGTTTDANGKYKLAVESLQDTLRFSYIGYTIRKIPIKGRTTINVTLKTATTGLEQMVVTGFGSVSQKKFTGSSSEVSSKDIESQLVTSPGQALEGTATGLQYTSDTGSPGSVAQFQIRGVSSINTSTQPLFIIDGTPVKGGQLNSGEGARGYTSLGLLQSLDPSDIKSMTVLKGASATSLYGARGSNGVIVIETKEGVKSQKTQFSFNIQRGASKRAVHHPKELTGQQWAELYRAGLINAGVDPANAQAPWDGKTSTNWFDLLSRDQAISQKYSISASGGNDQTTFFTSLNYNSKEGVLIGSDFDRIGGRLNLTYDLTKTATISNKITASSVHQFGINEGGGNYNSPASGQYELRPTLRVFNEDGTPNIENWPVSYSNLIWVNQHDIRSKRAYRILDNTKLDLDLWDNLMFSSEIGLDYIATEEKYYRNPIHGGSERVNGSISSPYTRNFRYTWKNSLTYDWQINQDNDINIMVLGQAEKNNFYNIRNSAQNFATDGLTTAATAGTPTYVSTFESDWSSLAALGNLRYSFKDRYNLQASYRYEGSSRFAKENRWGGFYAIGASWIVTDEPFLEGSKDWLDNLKLRASYGLTGNASIGLNEYQALIGYSGSYDGRGVANPEQFGNRDLTWEKAESIEVGLDFGLLNRVRAEATYFRKNSKDLLLNVPLSQTTGQGSQRRNIGDLYNQGVELSLDVDIIQNNDIAWSLGLKYTKVKNEVTSLPKDANGNTINITTGRKKIAEIGYATGTWYMPTWAGVDPANGRPLWYKDVTDAEGNVTGRTTTSEYSKATRYHQGASPTPTDYGSINTHLNVKGFYLNAQLSFNYGNKIYAAWERYIRSDGLHNDHNQLFSAYADRWKKPGDHALNPQIISGGNHNSTQTSTRFLYSGDYLRLTNLTLGYNIPSSVLSHLRMGLSSITVYAMGRNIWTYVYDNNLVMDPQVRQDGLLYFKAQPLATVSAGINVKF